MTRRISQWLAGVSTLALVGAIGLIASHPAAAAGTGSPPTVSVPFDHVTPLDLVASVSFEGQVVQFDVATKSKSGIDPMVSSSPATACSGVQAKTQATGGDIPATLKAKSDGPTISAKAAAETALRTLARTDERSCGTTCPARASAETVAKYGGPTMSFDVLAHHDTAAGCPQQDLASVQATPLDVRSQAAPL